jgi:hypothetical protein
MGHPKPFIIKTRPDTPEETAKRLGLSKTEFHKIIKLVDEIVGPVAPTKRKGTIEKPSRGHVRSRPSRLPA